MVIDPLASPRDRYEVYYTDDNGARTRLLVKEVRTHRDDRMPATYKLEIDAILTHEMLANARMQVPTPPPKPEPKRKGRGFLSSIGKRKRVRKKPKGKNVTGKLTSLEVTVGGKKIDMTSNALEKIIVHAAKGAPGTDLTVERDGGRLRERLRHAVSGLHVSAIDIQQRIEHACAEVIRTSEGMTHWGIIKGWTVEICIYPVDDEPIEITPYYVNPATQAPTDYSKPHKFAPIATMTDPAWTCLGCGRTQSDQIHNV